MTKKQKHIHHIIPKHMGGSDEPENLIELTVAEHAEAHRILYETHHHWQDYLAWKGLAGYMDKEEIIFHMLSEAGKRGAATTNSMVFKRGPKPGEYTPVGTGGLKWYHNPNNPIEKRCLKDIDEIPDGWLRGQGKKQKHIQ